MLKVIEWHVQLKKTLHSKVNMGIDDHSKLEEKVMELERVEKVLGLLLRTREVGAHIKAVMKLNCTVKRYKGDRFAVTVLHKGIMSYLKVMKLVEDAAQNSICSPKGQSFTRAIKFDTKPLLLELSRARITKDAFSDDDCELLKLIYENTLCLNRPTASTCDVSIEVDKLNPNHEVPVIAVDADLQCEKLWARVKARVAKKTKFYQTDYIGDSVSLLQREFYQTAKAFVFSGMYPLFVFDGEPPKEKSAKYERYKKDGARLEARAEKCNEQFKKSEELGLPVADFIAEEKRKLFMQMERIPKGTKRKIRELVKSMGLPVVQADGEADPYCVFLERIGIADAVYTTDSDVLVHGAKYRFKTFSSLSVDADETRGIKAHSKILLNGTSRERLLEAAKLNSEQYRDLCILAQCDYNTRVSKYGMITAYKDMRELGSLERILEEKLADRDTSGLNIEACRRLFNRKEYKLDPNELYASSTILETSGIQHLSELGLGNDAAGLLLKIELLTERGKAIVVPDEYKTTA